MVAFVLAVGGFVAAAGRPHDKSSWTFSPLDGDSALPPTTEAPPIPAPKSVVQRALAIARQDELFRRLAARRRPRLVETGDWATIDGDRLGASLTFRLREPIEVNAVLPFADIPPDAPTTGECEAPYRQTWLRETSAGVTELRFLVDLHRRAVVEVSTNAKRGRRSWVEGRPHPSCEAVASG